MKVTFSEFAVVELNDAAAYLEMEFEGLGDRFKEDVRQAVKRIVQYPDAWPAERQEIRKCLLHKFRYKLLYSIEPDHIS